MTDWGTPNRISLGREHPVRCVQQDCITILSVYNGCADNDCWVHCRCPGVNETRALAERLSKR